MGDQLKWKLHGEGHSADSMHGGRSQDQREMALKKFKNSEVRLLVATDVMGRGLDIPTISHVVQYDMGDVEDYVHRIGRTARGLSGLQGHALTLFEYQPTRPDLAAGLLQVLEESQQPVPPGLRKIAEEVANGWRQQRKGMHAKKQEARHAFNNNFD